MSIIMSKSLLERTRIKLGCNAQYGKSIADPEMCIFFEKDMGGGVSYIFNNYIKANNKYLKSYDPKKELRHIIYLDTNNLYSYAMPSFF